MADVTGVQAATLPQPGADMATIRKRSLDIHNRAIGLLESAHARIQYAMEALHHDKPESYDENLRAYQQASRARPAWLPEHTPRGEVGPCMRTANDHISRAKSDIHEAFSALPSLHLGHSELCSSASGEAVACSLRAGGATAGSDVQECVAFLNKLDSQLMPCIDQVRHNKAAYERAVAKYG